MENKRSVYLLDPQIYAPETIAVTFAKTSRSPESFRQIAAELNDEKSAQFNEKWVVGYGHSSVAEHAVLHIAVENISRLACECLESNRLASYTEKSTRYQTWSADAYFLPPELMNTIWQDQYKKVCGQLLHTYLEIIPRVTEYIAKTNPQQTSESSAAWERRIKSSAVDNCRFLLPAAVLANVGITINARALEHALVKMLSHPLREVREMGAEIKQQTIQSVPTLLKYADAHLSLSNATQQVIKIDTSDANSAVDWCRIQPNSAAVGNDIFAAYFFRVYNYNYAQCKELVFHMTPAERSHLAEIIMLSSDPHAAPLRELENSLFTFEITVDQGAYYEVKRHRMMTLTAQPLTTLLGFAIPRAIDEAGCSKPYTEAMLAADEFYRRLAQEFPQEASYVVPNGFNRRFLLTANLRSLAHFIKLRSASNAHYSVRRLAHRMVEELSPALPAFSPLLVCNESETSSSITSKYFANTMER